jgi:hypothetical protein
MGHCKPVSYLVQQPTKLSLKHLDVIQGIFRQLLHYILHCQHLITYEYSMNIEHVVNQHPVVFIDISTDEWKLPLV